MLKIKNRRSSGLFKYLQLINIINLVCIVCFTILIISLPTIQVFKEHRTQQTLIKKYNLVTLKSVNLLKEFEGFSAYSYHCAAGVKTIGYGNTTYVAQHPHINKITEEYATKLLKADVSNLVAKLHSYKAIPRTQQKLQQIYDYRTTLNVDEQSVLISLMYNIGSDRFEKSTLKKFIDNYIITKETTTDVKKIRSALKQIEIEFSKWVYVKADNHKIIAEGLVYRRSRELKIFNDTLNLSNQIYRNGK